jgi:hypothetical protein
VSADRIRIDDTYTYVFDRGVVSILRHGNPWLGGHLVGAFPGAKAWIAAAAEIADLRERVGLADTIAERAFAYANQLEAAGLHASADGLREAPKGRS